MKILVAWLENKQANMCKEETNHRRKSLSYGTKSNQITKGSRPLLPRYGMSKYMEYRG